MSYEIFLEDQIRLILPLEHSIRSDRDYKQLQIRSSDEPMTIFVTENSPIFVLYFSYISLIFLLDFFLIWSFIVACPLTILCSYLAFSLIFLLLYSAPFLPCFLISFSCTSFLFLHFLFSHSFFYCSLLPFLLPFLLLFLFLSSPHSSPLLLFHFQFR